MIPGSPFPASGRQPQRAAAARIARFLLPADTLYATRAREVRDGHADCNLYTMQPAPVGRVHAESRESLMDIHVCARCEGSGHVTGGFGWEVPWPKWARDASQKPDSGILPPHACPDCGGAGTLLDMSELADGESWPAHRNARRTYADHVAHVLQLQKKRPQAN